MTCVGVLLCKFCKVMASKATASCHLTVQFSESTFLLSYYHHLWFPSIMLQLLVISTKSKSLISIFAHFNCSACVILPHKNKKASFVSSSIKNAITRCSAKLIWPLCSAAMDFVHEKSPTIGFEIEPCFNDVSWKYNLGKIVKVYKLFSGEFHIFSLQKISRGPLMYFGE